MATNAKNLAELLNTDTTVKVGDIEDGSVTSAKLASGAVTTAKIADDAVSSAKLFSTNLGRRNVIINGAMEVAQRGTSATGRGASSNFIVDRFKANHNGNSAGRYTVSRAADVHDGFSKALKFECTTADTSIGSSERFFIEQPIEGQFLQQFRKGSSDAKDFVVSFYAKANGNFTYVCGFYDADNDRTVSRTFAVTSSWQRFEINFGADTTGAFATDAGLSLQLRWYLHAGSGYTSASLQTSWDAVNNAATAGGMTSSFFSSTSNTFFLTGVQLEVGDKGDGTSTATPFEYRNLTDELPACERYYQKSYNYGNAPGANSSAGGVYERNSNAANISNRMDAGTRFVTRMRGTPTVTIYSLTGTGNNISDLTTGTGHSANQGVNSIQHRGATGFGGLVISGGNDEGIGYQYTAEAEI
jgi:hypothetical protein